NIATNDSSNVTIGSGNTSFTNSTLTVAAVNGTATFSNLKPLTVGSGRTLTASDGLLTGTNSSAFTVTVAAATRLVFAVSPAGAVYKTAFTTQPAVKTQDDFGNDSTNGLPSTLTVSLALTSGTGPLAGTTNLNIGMAGGAGFVTFAGLQINKAEN